MCNCEALSSIGFARFIVYDRVCSGAHCCVLHFGCMVLK
ncbi:hypothetical protein APHWI1_0368 [Anaplasma phagocytophilum str. ApWI1]|uniref:Uncharacterized protein n=1 Tax=Anaplasma phagocytophilum str. ApWI1 TaxID=1359155 RepID=A0A0F3PYI1_ANAPH|nr:hypothetical protein APHHGE2_1165 [Anaplasma phagocytophilum str. HGE2]KJV85333.1 hypothetical protein APHWI1_0368 [Anaplasma phagocytophilum str. ApWI1]KJV87112.1 hypothetical protein APHNYW_0880 [Anaplasma phagocytophilum str. ApNYW]KJV98409.1 hypothetical protein OTSANNIE_1136 [Anaplasma phagocytophilum str. Annie]KKA00027.1 hypothetical protein APHDU1_0164 [Anaplasma phagocytophilum]